MNVVEQVARAIAEADERNGAAPYDLLMTMGKHVKEHLYDRARAAIDVLGQLPDDMLVAHSKASEQEWDLWGIRDHRWGGKGWEVFRHDGSDIVGSFSEIESFETEKDALNALERRRRIASARAALGAIGRPSQ